MTRIQNYVDIPFELTQADIDAGLEHDCRNCPMALAIQRFLGHEFPLISVHPNLVSIGSDILDATWYPFSKKVKTIIEGFDRGLGMQPASFRFHFLPTDTYHPTLQDASEFAE